MLLRDALVLSGRALIAVVGAGGKTALTQRLAAELAGDGACVVLTTTTAIWEPRGFLIVEADPTALVAAVASVAAPGRIITVAAGRRMERDGVTGHERAKLAGVAPGVAQQLLAPADVDAVVVEADGARGRSIKAPAAHEPVVPPAATHVVAVAGIDAMGRPLDERIAHRPELISALLGIPIGTVLTAQYMAALLAHPDGGRKGVPASATFTVFLNKVEGDRQLSDARAVAALLAGAPGVDAVAIGAVQAAEPVLEVWR